MKLSIVINATPKATPLAADIPLEDAVALAGSVGFDGVELAIADPQDVDVANLTKMLESYGLKVPALGTGAAYKEGLSMAHPDARNRKGAIERLKAHVDLGAVLGADVIVGLIRVRCQTVFHMMKPSNTSRTDFLNYQPMPSQRMSEYC